MVRSSCSTLFLLLLLPSVLTLAATLCSAPVSRPRRIALRSHALKHASLTSPRFACNAFGCGRLAQLARAPRLHRGGQRFKSFSAHSLLAQGNSEQEGRFGFRIFVFEFPAQRGWGCSSTGSERCPVTAEVAGSSPVTPASFCWHKRLNCGGLCLSFSTFKFIHGPR